MNRREKILFLVAAVAALLWVGLPGINSLFFAPIEQSQQRLDDVNEQLARKTRQAVHIKEAGQQLKRWRARSLPANPLDAQRLYQFWLTDLAQASGFKALTVTPGRRIPRSKVYTGVLVSLEGKATLSQLARFLYDFYRIDLPHRISSMTIKSPGTSGNPVLTISLTAEGLAFAGAAQRSELLARTTLVNAFQSESDKQTIEVTDSKDFPQKPDFRIRIGNEYLTVTNVSGNTWTVRGGSDGTSLNRHQQGETVELAPIRLALAARTFDAHQALVAHSPFAKPVPPKKTPVTRRPKPPRVVPKEDIAAKTYLAASITKDDVPQAWLYRRSSKPVRTVLYKGSELSVDDIQAVVLDIEPEYVLFRRGDDVWKLRLGDNLRSMEKLPRPAGFTTESSTVKPSTLVGQSVPVTGSPTPVRAVKPAQDGNDDRRIE